MVVVPPSFPSLAKSLGAARHVPTTASEDPPQWGHRASTAGLLEHGVPGQWQPGAMGFLSLGQRLGGPCLRMVCTPGPAKPQSSWRSMGLCPSWALGVAGWRGLALWPDKGLALPTGSGVVLLPWVCSGDRLGEQEQGEGRDG